MVPSLEVTLELVVVVWGHFSWRSSEDHWSRQRQRTAYGDADLITLFWTLDVLPSPIPSQNRRPFLNFSLLCRSFFPSEWNLVIFLLAENERATGGPTGRRGALWVTGEGVCPMTDDHPLYRAAPPHPTPQVKEVMCKGMSLWRCFYGSRAIRDQFIWYSAAAGTSKDVN